MRNLIIFDCDGVLVDSEIIANKVDTEILNKLGYKITLEENIKRFTGISVKEVNKIIFNETGIIISEASSNDRQFAIYKAFQQDGLKPLMYDFLHTLDKKNFDICVASSSPKDRVTGSLKLTDQFKYFVEENIFTAQQVQNGKPAPDLFLYVASSLGYSAEDCIVIEDSTAGIEAALAAKMKVIGFLGGSHAQYQWYQERIKVFGVPVAYSTAELNDTILGMCDKCI